MKLFSGLDVSGMWKVLKESGLTGNEKRTNNLDVNVINDFFVDNPNSFGSSYVDFGSYDAVNGMFSFKCISANDLLEAICRVKSKSLGTDKIPIRFIKVIYPYISTILAHHVNSILCSSTFPSSWKTARVVPIPKSRYVHGVEDLRPISILPALSKVVEHIMKDQILLFVHRYIDPLQFAFRRGHSTTSLLLNLTDDVRSHLNDGKIAAIVSLDLSKAFNSVDYSVMIRKLREIFFFSATACKLIFSFLSDRFQFVDVNNQYSGLLRLNSGVPQGSVLGPILFILYINDLSACVNNCICKSYSFADDVFLLFNCKRSEVNTFQLNINDTLLRFLFWCSDNLLSINTSKTKALAFGFDEQLLSNVNLYVGESCVELVDRLKCPLK